ncbi:MAG: hypothetical protein FWG91_02610 [Lachnospiraceae bacterium]|nr:hypothetical protein [Lachnospiraceae bacterium]
MSRKKAIVLIVLGAVLIVFGIGWDVLSAIGVITSKLYTPPFFMAGVFGVVFGMLKKG